MKNHLFPLLAAGTVVIASLLTGCDDDGSSSKTSVNMTVGTPTAYSVEVTLKTNKISRYAYLCTEEGEEAAYVDEAVIFQTGETGTVSDGTNYVTVAPLDELTSYTLYFAFATTDDKYYGEIKSASITTGEYTESGITITSIEYDGFNVHIELPESCKEAGHAIRYTMRYLSYDYELTGGDDVEPEDMVNYLCFNGHQYTLEDADINFTDASMYDEDGDYVHDVMVPGELIVFYAGEFSYSDDPPAANYTSGYWEPEFLDSDGFYDANEGFYERMVLRTKEPDLLDASLNMEVSNVGPADASIIINPDDEIVWWAIMVCDEDSYTEYVLPYVDYREDCVQAFVTSYYANYLGWAGSYSGSGYLQAMELCISDSSTSGLLPNTTYRVMAVGSGNSEGTTQVFEQIQFTTTEKTLPAPEVVVTPLSTSPETGAANPYQAWFNIKATNGDVVSACYIADYAEHWRSYSPLDLLPDNGTSFTTDELSAINSDEGYNVYFSSRAGATTQLAVYAYNTEYTSNEEDLGSDSPLAMAQCTTTKAEAKDPVTSDLYDELCGEWTMSYTAYGDSTITGPVTIVRQLTYDDTPSSDVYDVYSAYETEYVDSLWDDYKETLAYFNEEVLSNQNRLLCIGFSTFDCATPYELFTSDSYSAYNSDDIVNDFGPKWYLEVLDANTVAAPINTERLYPAAAWASSYYTYYFVGFYSGGWLDYIAYGDDYEDAYFDVTISEDKDTLTISPIYDETTGTTYYPNLPYITSSYALSVSGKICVSEVVLTRNNAATVTSTSSASKVAAVKAKAARSNSKTGLSSRQHFTPIANAKPVEEYKKLQITVLDKALGEQGREKMRESFSHRTAENRNK